jgi:hypothetical protein
LTTFRRGEIEMSYRSGVAFLIALAVASLISVTGISYGRAAEQVPSPKPRYFAKEVGWSLKLPTEEIVAYQGVVSLDGAGMGTGHMMYPAPNIAGFFVAILTHSVLLQGSRSAQKTKIQEAADKVLLPYKPVLSDYKYRDLMQQALAKATTAGNKRLLEPSEKPGADLRIESMPVFSMTQDQTAIVLDNAVAIYGPGAAQDAAYKNIIRVVSRTESSTDLVNFWSTNEGAAIKAESARLLAESLDIALDEIAAEREQERPQQTVRYVEGNAEKMERGQILKDLCNRVVLKNLRGWIMSVPIKPAAGATSVTCGNGVPQ